jgi:hypothetical protein
VGVAASGFPFTYRIHRGTRRTLHTNVQSITAVPRPGKTPMGQIRSRHKG